MESCNRMASGRCSRLRPPATERGLVGHVSIFLLLAAAAVSGPAASQASGDDPAARETGAGGASHEAVREAAAGDDTGAAEHTGSDLLDRFLDDVATLEARFEQELTTADGRLAERQSGTLSLERPSRFRWHYTEPFEQLLVADGEHLWMYDVDLEQVTVTPLDDAASTPAMLLSGDSAVREGFSVVDESADDGLRSVLLEPKLEGTDFRSVRIGFDGLTPRRLELVDGLGQTTTIDLFDVELNGDPDEDAFRFDPPRGVDVIGEPAR